MSVAPCGVRPVAVGVHPDYVVHVRPDILHETDGPMLRHGLQGLQGQLPPQRSYPQSNWDAFDVFESNHIRIGFLKRFSTATVLQ